MTVNVLFNCDECFHDELEENYRDDHDRKAAVRFRVPVSPEIENGLCGEEINEGFDQATSFGYVTCPAGHTMRTEYSVDGGSDGSEERIGTWSET